MRTNLKTDAAQGFTSPTALPESTAQAKVWQELNRSWWEQHPMRYDWGDPIPAPEFSAEFYRNIDRRFLSDAKTYMPWRERPFDALINFAALKNQDVLEIGVGNGTHAQLLAGAARSFTGIDLTEYAVKSTTVRLRLAGLPARILRMDAEQLQFPDGSFDFVWSWGVIHHSADTARVLQQIHRVLRPGGTAVIMVYHRSWWYYYVVCGLLHGILRGELLRTKSLHRITQRWTDGALARFYVVSEWCRLVSPWFEVQQVRIFGSKSEAVPIPAGAIKQAVLRWLPDAAARLLLNSCRAGSFLVTALQKKEI
jgi:SAM-dependent methyltransferase